MTRETVLRIRFWGVRGSYPTPGPSTVRMGGNSSCVEMEAGGRTLIFDAGTGLIGLGTDLVRRRGRKRKLHIFLSHTHHDHIEGLRFFEPFYRSEWDCRVYGPVKGKETLQNILSRIMRPGYFPVSFDDLPSRPALHPLADRESVSVAGSPALRVDASHSRSHPKHGVTLFRVTCRGRSVVYATDVEGPKGGEADVIAFARDADVLIHDAQYTDEEYSCATSSRVGWGHSTVRMAAEVARAAGVKKLVLFHHDPSHDDRQVEQLERSARRIFPASQAAREGLELGV